MKISVSATDPGKLEVDTLIAFSYESKVGEIVISPSLDKRLQEAVKRENFTGKEDKKLIFSAGDDVSAYRVIVVGLGEQKEFSAAHIQEAVAKATKTDESFQETRKAAFILPTEWLRKKSASEVVHSVVMGIRLASYKFLKYKSEKEKDHFTTLTEVVISLSESEISTATESIKIAQICADGVCFARDLVNEPPHWSTPTQLSQVAKKLEEDSKGEVRVEIFGRDEVEEMRMEAFLGVAKGSDEPLKFIKLIYEPAKCSKRLTIIGKGITFDTGGLSLKSAENMETMKLDMAGAAAVLGVFSCIARLKPSVCLTGLIAACENMPSGRALRPGDILRAYNGKTIEVINTDAEGRLTLADMLSFAVKNEKQSAIIDIATLTGACVVALGEEIAGGWSNSEELAAKVEQAAEKSGEKLWRFPLETAYRPLLKSTIADLRNVQTGKYGGAITAAIFLSEFVGNTPWYHIDIAGPGFAEKDMPICQKGGTGYGVSLLLAYLSSLL